MGDTPGQTSLTTYQTQITSTEWMPPSSMELRISAQSTPTKTPARGTKYTLTVDTPVLLMIPMLILLLRTSVILTTTTEPLSTTVTRATASNSTGNCRTRVCTVPPLPTTTTTTIHTSTSVTGPMTTKLIQAMKSTTWSSLNSACMLFLTTKLKSSSFSLDARTI